MAMYVTIYVNKPTTTPVNDQETLLVCADPIKPICA